MSLRNAFLLAASLCLISACEKIDLEEENGDSDAEHIVPHTVGMGTQEAPYTVRQLLQGDILTAQEAWVIGYIVGSTYRSMSNAIFAGRTTYTGNILISYDSLCSSENKCIAVELASTSIQKRLSLASDSTHYRKCVAVNGTIGRYFNRVGLREAKEGYLLPGIDLQAIDPRPTDWEEIENKY